MNENVDIEEFMQDITSVVFSLQEQMNKQNILIARVACSVCNREFDIHVGGRRLTQYKLLNKLLKITIPYHGNLSYGGCNGENKDVVPYNLFIK